MAHNPPVTAVMFSQHLGSPAAGDGSSSTIAAAAAIAAAVDQYFALDFAIIVDVDSTVSKVVFTRDRCVCWGGGRAEGVWLW